MHLAAFFHEILINAAAGQKGGHPFGWGSLLNNTLHIQFITQIFPPFLILLHRCRHVILLYSKFEKL